MWRALLPEVPRYLIKGKGYALNPGDVYMEQMSAARGFGLGTASSNAFTGEYHNGPLSVLIPFGIWGALALSWFLVAAGRVLHLNYVWGDPSLKTLNRVLLACFIVKVISFLFIFGTLESDLAYFAGLVGFAVSLNGEVKRTAPDDQELDAVPDMMALRMDGGI